MSWRIKYEMMCWKCWWWTRTQYTVDEQRKVCKRKNIKNDPKRASERVRKRETHGDVVWVNEFEREGSSSKKLKRAWTNTFFCSSLWSTTCLQFLLVHHSNRLLKHTAKEKDMLNSSTIVNICLLWHVKQQRKRGKKVHTTVCTQTKAIRSFFLYAKFVC